VKVYSVYLPYFIKCSEHTSLMKYSYNYLGEKILVNPIPTKAFSVQCEPNIWTFKECAQCSINTTVYHRANAASFFH